MSNSKSKNKKQTAAKKHPIPPFGSERSAQPSSSKQVQGTNGGKFDLIDVLKYVLQETPLPTSIPDWARQYSTDKYNDAFEKFLQQSPTHLQIRRWHKGLFDSITSHFVIGDIVVQNEIVPGPPQNDSFLRTGKQQYEDLTTHPVLSVRDWEVRHGEDPTIQCIAWREKRNGVPIVFTGVELRCCHLTTSWTKAFFGELTESGIYQLYPYSHVQMPFRTVHSDWQSFRFPKRYVSEGIIMLDTQGNSYRVKVNPTVELENYCQDCEGVWEYGLDSESLFPIRPRFNKKPGDIASLSKMMYYDELRWDPLLAKDVFVSDSAKEIEERDGLWSIPASNHEDGGLVVQDTVTHGSKIRLAFSGEGVYPAGLGSKLIVIHAGELYLFKDGQKHWDCIGGGVEPGESTLGALIREIGEECPSLLDTLQLEKIELLGYCVNDDGWQSAVYFYESATPLPAGFASTWQRQQLQQWTSSIVCFGLYKYLMKEDIGKKTLTPHPSAIPLSTMKHFAGVLKAKLWIRDEERRLMELSFKPSDVVSWSNILVDPRWKPSRAPFIAAFAYYADRKSVV